MWDQLGDVGLPNYPNLLRFFVVAEFPAFSLAETTPTATTLVQIVHANELLQ